MVVPEHPTEAIGRSTIAEARVRLPVDRLGPKLQRLARAKSKHDPGSLFRAKQNIRPG